MANKLTPISSFSDLARFEPFRNLETFFNDFRFRPALQTFDAEPAIRMDVSENEDAYRIKAEILGVKKDDIKVPCAWLAPTVPARPFPGLGPGTRRCLFGSWVMQRPTQANHAGHDGGPAKPGIDLRVARPRQSPLNRHRARVHFAPG